MDSSKKAIQTSRWSQIIFYIILILMALAIILPFLHILALAFNSGKDAARGGIAFFPREFTFENFREVFKQDNLINGFFISIFRTVVGTALGVFLMSMAAWALTIPDLPGRGRLHSLYFLPCYLVVELSLTIWYLANWVLQIPFGFTLFQAFIALQIFCYLDLPFLKYQ